jgi:hypothetical protein
MLKWFKYWRCRLFRHSFVPYGNGIVYHQRSRLVRCRKCQAVFFGPAYATIEEFNKMP